MMENIDEKYDDLQEITFWQQLNKQLIEKRKLGMPITDNNQKALQKFGFANQLFRRITEDPLIDEIPIALVTDFGGVTALTFYIDSWNECITSLLPNSISIDVEQAQADAFDTMTDLDRKYRFFETTPEDIKSDDDEELYAFIDEYNSMVEKQGRDLRNALRILYELKAASIDKIEKEHGGMASLVIGRKDILLDFRHTDDRDRVMSVYLNYFCDQSISKISKFTDATGAFLDMEILGLLYNKESEPKLKRSIREFIQHERQLIERQSKLMRDFNHQLKSKLDSKSDYRIKILNLSPFAFLKSPFPEV
jgi:hypothetical protein